MLGENGKRIKNLDKINRKQTLESLNPWILGPSSPNRIPKHATAGKGVGKLLYLKGCLRASARAR